MLDMVKYTDEKGQAVEFTAEDVRARLCPNIDAKELALVMGLCQAQNLNPFTRDVYIIKYGNSPASIVTGKEVFTKRAQANPRFKGYKAGVVYLNGRKEVCKREGGAIYKAAGETLLGGWCEVYVEGCAPFYNEVALEEYQQTKTDPKTGDTVPAGNWARMGCVMIRKCALVASLREAFPRDYKGLYISEEMGKDGERAEQIANEPQERAQIVDVVEVEPLANAEQVEQLQTAIWKLADLRGVSDQEVINGLLKSKALEGLTDLAEASEAEAARALVLLARWIEKATAEAATAPQTSEQPSALDVAMENAEAAQEIPF